MSDLVFVLCAATSLAVAVLLLRGYARGRARLLLWSGLCFVFMFLSNVLLIVDVNTPPEMVDLSFWRSVPTLVGIGLLLFGLIWDAR
jgi:hypothetical protein